MHHRRRTPRHPNIHDLSLPEGGFNPAQDWSTPIELSGRYRPFPSVSFPPTSYTSPLDPVPTNSPVIPQPSLTDSPPPQNIPVIPPEEARPPPGSNDLPPIIPVLPDDAQPAPWTSVPGLPPRPWMFAPQAASIEQVKELMRYLHGLSEWLGRDVQDRQAEVRTLVARMDSLRNEVGRIAFGGSPQDRGAALHGVASRVNTLSNDVRQFASASRNIAPPGVPLPNYGGQPPNVPHPPGWAAGRPGLWPGAPPPRPPSLKFHQMLLPPSDDSLRNGLQWDLMFPSSHVHLDGTDSSTWINMREGPATDPRVPLLNLASKAFPWIIPVHASHSQLGVSCADIIDTVAEFMGQLVSEQDFNRFPFETRRMVTEGYHRNRIVAREVLGTPGLGTGIKRLDWLGQETIFGGIEQNDKLVMEMCGGSPPPFTFALLRIRKSH